MSGKPVYLREDVKAALEREARQRGCSEAEVVRQALAAAVSAPHPRPGFLDAEPFAARADELLEGFGVR